MKKYLPLLGMLVLVCGAEDGCQGYVTTSSINESTRFKIERVIVPATFPDIAIITDTRTHREIVVTSQGGHVTVLETIELTPEKR